MYIHSKQRRSCGTRPFQESTDFTLPPPRPRSHGDTQLSSRGSEPRGLQVQGVCCPLQQRLGSGRVTPQSRGRGDGGLILLSSVRGSVESTAKPGPRARTGNRPVLTPQGGAPNACDHRDQANETAETPTTPCDNQRQARHGRPGAAKVPELHLYLPSSLCEDEDEDEDSEMEEMRPSAEKTVFKSLMSKQTTPAHQRFQTLHAPAGTRAQHPSLEDSEHS